MKAFYQYNIDDISVLQTPMLWQSYQAYNYMLARDNKAWIFDPGEMQPIDNTLVKNNLQPQAIYLTHHHNDHVGATKDLVKKYSCPVFGFSGDNHRLPSLTDNFDDQATLEIAGHQAQVLHLPGHTLGLCAFYFQKLGLLFSNDLLFSLGCGRVFEGSFDQMYQSLNQIRQFPDETLVFASHEYTLQNLNFAIETFPDDSALNEIKKNIIQKNSQNLPTLPTRIGFEKKYNPFLRWDDPAIRSSLGMQNYTNEQVFAKIRQLKDRY